MNPNGIPSISPGLVRAGLARSYLGYPTSAEFGDSSLTAGVPGALYRARRWREIRGRRCMKKDELKIADWAIAELRKKRRSELGARLAHHVRGVYFLLMIGTIVAFMTDKQVQIENTSLAELHFALKKVMLSEKLRQQALNYETEVDKINDNFKNQP